MGVVSRVSTLSDLALLAQSVEHLHGKEGVDGSSPSEGLAGSAWFMGCGIGDGGSEADGAPKIVSRETSSFACAFVARSTSRSSSSVVITLI